MALIKSKTLSSGVSGEYWRITQITVNKCTHKVSYELSLYVSQAQRQSGASALDFKKIFIFDASPSELNGDLTALGYAKIKAKANSQVSDPFSKEQFPPTVPGDADLNGCVNS